MKRAIERFLVYPLSNLVATGQIGLGDLVYVDLNSNTKKLVFSKQAGGALISDVQHVESHSAEPAAKSGAAALPIPQVKVARKGQGRTDKQQNEK